MKKHIVMIGMPGSGKSTLGREVAEKLGYNFLDSDRVIEEKKGKKLHEIVNEVGKEGFNKIEEEINCTINPDIPTVIATGGSVVYGEKAMKHFMNIATVVYIQLSLDTVIQRLGDFKKRGISMNKGETIEDLYNERCGLYERYSHIVVNTENSSIHNSTKIIINSL